MSKSIGKQAEIEERIRAAGGRILHVPAEHRSHPLIAGRFFYTLPPKLWSEILKVISPNRFSSEVLSLELAPVGKPDWRSDSIGFRDGFPIAYHPLHVEHRVDAVTQPARMRHRLTASAAKLNQHLAGYLGWLLTNSEFNKEHRSLFADCSEVLSATAGPFQMAAISASDGNPMPGWSQRQATRPEAAVAKFSLRWRLQGIAGPYLVDPLCPQFAVGTPSHATALANATGMRLIALPDTLPIPTERELRSLVEEAVRSQEPSHLDDWFKIVRAGNAAKNEVLRYARIFRLQHFVCVLMSRHAEAFRGQRGRLNEAFAEHLNVSEPTIRGDLRIIAKRLGPGWENRHIALL